MSRLVYVLSIAPLICCGELLWESDFEGADGFVNGPLNGQGGWTGDDDWVVDSSHGKLSLNAPYQHLAKLESVTLNVWDRLTMVVTVRVDLSKDVNQTPFRFGFTSSTDENDRPMPLPFGNSNFQSTALAAELFRSGYPYLQSQGATHHTGTLTLAPYFGAPEGVISVAGHEVGIYPHARLQVLTLANGDEDGVQPEIQFISPIPLASGPAFGAGDRYRLIFEGEETSDLLVSSTEGDVQTALERVATIGAGNVSVMGSFTDGFEVAFAGSLLNQDVTQLEVIEPSVQDHLTQNLELTYEVLKAISNKTFLVQASVKNLDTGAVFIGQVQELVDNFAHSDSEFYPSLRGGNFAEGGSLVIDRVAVFFESADDDQDEDGFTNRIELQLGSDYRDRASTPLGTQVLLTNFSGGDLAPLDDSPDWFASELWMMAAAGGAQHTGGPDARAITEASSSIEPGEILFSSVEFRLTGGINFAIQESPLFNLGVTEQLDPDSVAFRVASTLNSTPVSNGMLFLDELELGPAGEFFDNASYDAVTDEAVIAGMPRATAPSDWMRLDLALVKGEVEGEWTIRKQLHDLEGEHQGKWVSEQVFTNSTLWNDSSIRSGFDSAQRSVSGVSGGLEVRKFDFRKVKSGDFDADRLSNLDELFIGTSSQSQDSDGDLQADWYEFNGGSDPMDANSMVTNIPLIQKSVEINNWGNVTFELTGRPGGTVIIEESNDLKNWTEPLTQPSIIGLFGEANLFSFFDPRMNQARYFRVRMTDH